MNYLAFFEIFTRWLTVICMALFFLGGTLQAQPLQRPFITDGCTGWFDGTRRYDWSHCCQRHDLQFWAGGIKKYRKQADRELFECIKKESNSFHATIIRAGVWLGSLSPIKIEDKKWGNAWGQKGGYYRLSLEQVDLIERSMHRDQNHYSIAEIEAFISQLKCQNQLGCQPFASGISD